MNPIRAFKFNY